VKKHGVLWSFCVTRGLSTVIDTVFLRKTAHTNFGFSTFFFVFELGTCFFFGAFPSRESEEQRKHAEAWLAKLQVQPSVVEHSGLEKRIWKHALINYTNFPS